MPHHFDCAMPLNEVLTRLGMTHRATGDHRHDIYDADGAWLGRMSADEVWRWLDTSLSF